MDRFIMNGKGLTEKRPNGRISTNVIQSFCKK